MFIVHFIVQYRGWAARYKHVAVFNNNSSVESEEEAKLCVLAEYHNYKSSVTITSVTKSDKLFMVLGEDDDLRN